MTFIAPNPNQQSYSITVDFKDLQKPAANAPKLDVVARARLEAPAYRFDSPLYPKKIPGRIELPFDSTGATQPTVVLAQIEVKPGNPRANVAAMLKAIREAKAAGADVIAFPEMAISGYMIGDSWLSDSLCNELMMYNEQLKHASKGITVVWGNVYLDTPKRMAERGITGDHPNEDGGTRRYNGVFVAQNGEWAPRLNDTGLLPPGVMPKTLLPNYRFFDDKRYFHSTIQLAQDFGVQLERLVQPFVIEVGGKRIALGVQCCEDLWCKEYRRNGEALNVTKMLVDNGATRIINCSTSPWNEGKIAARDERILFLKQECGDKFPPFDYVNTVGVQNNGKNFVTFDGDSSSYGRDGKPVATAKTAYQRELVIVRPEMTTPIVRPNKRIVEEKYDALIQGIRAMGSEREWLIGMSGGVDSSVVAALLCEAVGADKVKSVNMPTEHNGVASRGRAQAAADRLGIEHTEESIQPIVDRIKEVNDRVRFSNSKKRSTLNDENIQAKIRGTDMQSNIASRDGMFFSNNGNKLELALGYATLYGDWGGALAVLGDLTKPEVWEMARYLNERYGREVVPTSLIPDHFGRFDANGAPPSAELKDKQIDPMKFYYHDALLDLIVGPAKATPSDIMQWFVDGSLGKRIEEQVAGMGVPVQNYPNYGAKLMERWGVNDPKTFLDDLKWFTGQMNAVYKRVQSPPIVVTSKSSFGYDYREAIYNYSWKSRESRRLTKEIREMPAASAAAA